MSVKLTDKDALIGALATDDWFHVVDKSDATSDPAGTSKKATIQQIIDAVVAGNTFLSLSDTPVNYIGQAGKAVAVNGGATGLEFIDFPSGAVWGLGGNAGTDDTLDFLGTTDAQDVVFKADGTEAARIRHEGQEWGFGKAPVAGRALSVTSFYADEKHFVAVSPDRKKEIVYGSLEGPENGVYFRAKTTSGVIELPPYWSWLVDAETIQATVTAIGPAKPYGYQAEGLTVKLNTEGEINASVVVWAERKDVKKLQVVNDLK